MGVASKRTTSWAVAAGVAAVEALKDQVGLCRWNYALRALQQHAKAGLKQSPFGGGAKSANTVNQARRLSGAIDHSTLAAVRAAREAEKAENVMHLVCWGPR